MQTKHHQAAEQIIIRAGLLASHKLEQAIAQSERQKIRLLPYLIHHDLIDVNDFATACANYYALACLDLKQTSCQDEAFTCIQLERIKSDWILPLEKTTGSIKIAIADPASLAQLPQLEFQTGLKIQPVFAPFDQLMEVINTRINALIPMNFDAVVDDDHIIHFVDHILSDAVHRNASDIHFEPFVDHYRIRTRIDGLLTTVFESHLNVANNISSRIKVLANMDVSEQRLPQDGRFQLTSLLGTSRDCRVNACPTQAGEKIVVRILNANQGIIKINDLGMQPIQQQHFTNAIEQPQGLVLVTGPTGSGKSITLYSALHHLNHSSKNISTVEDPVELKIPGINQIQINHKIGMDFAEALRALLRQDPDIIMIGEIRDAETAQMAIRAAQTGHLVLATLHTNSALESIARLQHLGIQPYLLATALKCVIAQRLARKQCIQCHGKQTACPYCNHGYQGRIGIYEVVPINKVLREQISQQSKIATLESTCQSLMLQTLQQSGDDLVKNHITTRDEIERCIYHEILQ